MPSRAADWYQQAQRDLEQAASSQREGRHEWACFAAQQAAEKAVKAVHLAHSQDAFYIPTRYANSHAEGPPFEHYGPLQSDEALRYAGEILGFAGTHLAGS